VIRRDAGEVSRHNRAMTDTSCALLLAEIAASWDAVFDRVARQAPDFLGAAFP
jgi:hypothetical protein